jgi:hypothetical protein
VPEASVTIEPPDVISAIQPEYADLFAHHLAKLWLHHPEELAARLFKTTGLCIVIISMQRFKYY